ncbi:MAG: hypothetical protein V1927_01090 [Candidatus Omnitrophota bacterium]
MNNKKVIILIVLGIAAVFSLIRGITAPARARRAISVSGTPDIIRQNENTPDVNEPAEIKRRAVRTKFKSWARSPFAPGGFSKSTSSSLSLGGIMWNAENPKAMIGDMIVKKGDKVGDYVVIQVRKDSVILNDGSKNIELKLRE